MAEEILEGVIESPVPTAADEQIQPEESVAEETTETKEPEKQISMSELMWQKLAEIKQQRANAISEEDRQKGMRLLRSPYDSLWFETAQDLENEVRAVREKTSKLSASQREALLMLQNYVIFDMSKAEETANSEDAAEAEVPETTEEKPVVEETPAETE